MGSAKTKKTRSFNTVAVILLDISATQVSDGQTEERQDKRTDGQGQTYVPPPPAAWGIILL